MTPLRARMTVAFVSLSLWSLSTCTAFSILPLRNYRVDYSSTACYNWLGLGDLWDEVIEFSTYGPAERRLLKAKREAAKGNTEDASTESFQQAKRNLESKSSQAPDEPIGAMEDYLSLQAFQAAVASKEREDDDGPDFDGYQLRDLLMERWGVPLDIEFQGGKSQQFVYCIVLPVAFGSRKCRHETELDYLMHLQGVIEILYKYDNLDRFIVFLQSTSRVPKAGVESVPYRMNLNDESLKQILGKR